MKKFAQPIMLLVALCAGIARGAGDDQPPKNPAELRQRIEKVIEETHTPAIGIALVNQDGPYWVAGWGKADIKSNRAADANTLFRIGSITKMFAALSVLKLVEEGRLSLDDKVRDRAPEIEFVNPWEDTHPVRIANLLEHTTGWDDMHVAEYAYSAPDTMSIRDGLAVHPDSRTSRWPPGTRHAYNNSGPTVAAYIVEKVTGKRYEDYVAETFFTPLGMTATTFFKTPAYDKIGATLYVGNQPQDYWHIIHRPSGSINSSATDMAKLLQFFVLRGATPTTRIVSEASIDRMEHPGSLPGNTRGVTAGYGLANYATGHIDLGVAFRGHNGGVNGGLSELMYARELGEGYVIMINSGNGAALNRVSEVLKGYLLRNRKSPQYADRALPAEFKGIDGYYQAINPRQEATRFFQDLAGVMKIWSDDKFLHRSPLFGGWISNDPATGEHTLTDRWSGLPAIAVVEDPLAGRTLQIGSDLYQPVTAWWVFGRLAVPAAMFVASMIGFVALIVWAVRRTRKKTADPRLMMRLWPLIATATFVAFFIALSATGFFLKQAGSVSALSIAIMLLSIAYPAAALMSAAQLFLPKGRQPRNLPYWFAALFAVLHLLIAVYLGAYGVIGMRTWA